MASSTPHPVLHLDKLLGRLACHLDLPCMEAKTAAAFLEPAIHYELLRHVYCDALIEDDAAVEAAAHIKRTHAPILSRPALRLAGAPPEKKPETSETVALVASLLDFAEKRIVEILRRIPGIPAPETHRIAAGVAETVAVALAAIRPNVFCAQFLKLGRLTPSFLVRALVHGKDRLFHVAFGALVNLDPDYLENMLVHDPEQFVYLYSWSRLDQSLLLPVAAAWYAAVQLQKEGADLPSRVARIIDAVQNAAGEDGAELALSLTEAEPFDENRLGARRRPARPRLPPNGKPQ